MSEFQHLSASELRDLLRRGEISPTELVTDSINEIEKRNELLGMFITVTEKQAQERARQLERQRGTHWHESDDLPPLWGMVHADKDLEERAGVPTWYGSKAGGQVAEKSNDVVEMADSLGLVSLGKTTTSEFGMYNYTEPEVGPSPRHPWNPLYGAGGSTGGSAVAVATGVLPFAIGSDGGGSIRVPAATLGIVGLKPTAGILPVDRGQTTPTNVVHGALGRSVADTKLLFDAMMQAGRRQVDLESLAENFPAIEQLRFGFAIDSPWNPGYDLTPNSTNLRALAKGIELLKALGATTDFPQISLAEAAYTQIFRTAWLRTARHLDTNLDLNLLQPATRQLVTEGLALSEAEITQNQADCLAYRQRVSHLWEEVDIVVTPALGTDPKRLGSFSADLEEVFYQQCQYGPYQSWANLAGVPAVTVPVGVYELEEGKSKLPFGIQLVGAPNSDYLLLSIAAQLESLVGVLQPPKRDEGDAWIYTSTGQKLWGKFGAAGLLLWDPRREAVLLQLRSPASHHGGTWGIPGGARKKGEDALSAACREAEEEAGVPPEVVRPLYQHVVEIEHWSYTTVVAMSTVSFEPNIQDWESEDLRWVPTHQVDQLPLHPGFAKSWTQLREYLANNPND